MRTLTIRVGLLLIAATILPSCDDTRTRVVTVNVPVSAMSGDGTVGVGAGYTPTVLIHSDANINDIYEILSADDSGTARANLSGPLVPGGDVSEAKWSPDKLQVAFIAEKDTLGVEELYVVPAVGGPIVKVSPPAPAHARNLQSLEWAPDNSRLTFLADHDTDNTTELYSVFPDGTGFVKINGALVNNHVWRYSWAPDASRIAYEADQDVGNQTDLYTSLPDGLGNSKVSGPLVANANVRDHFWAPDGSRIAYAADQDTQGTVELYSSLPVGGGNVKVNGALVAGGAVLWQATRWAPDSSRILYVADQDTNNENELYTSLPDGTGNVKINGAIVAGGTVFGGRWAPNSSRVFYAANQDSLTTIEGYTSLPAGGGNVKVTGAMTPGGNLASFPTWSPDSSLVAYGADQDTLGVTELYVSPATTAVGNVKVSGPMVAGGNLGTLETLWTPDNSRIVYSADQDTDDLSELYVSTADGVTNVKLNFPIVPGQIWGGVHHYKMASDGSAMYYAAEQAAAAKLEVYRVPILGGASTKLSASFNSLGESVILDNR